MPEPALPDAELDVMRCLWQAGPLSARAIRERLEGERPMTHSSVCTLLIRLERKRCVTRERGPVGKAFLYSAAIRPQPTQRRLVGALRDRLFAGDPVALIGVLLAERPPTRTQLDAYQRLLDKHKDYPLVPQAGEGNDGRVAFREPRDASQDDRQVSPIDPRKLLFDFPSRDTAGELAKLLASDLEKDVVHVRDVELTVSQAESDGKVQFKVTHHSPLPNGVDISVERVFAEDADYSPIYESLFRLPERVLVQRDEWSYRRVDGIVLPATQRRRLLTLDGGRLNHDRTYTLRESSVNQPLAEDTFTVSNFALQKGDRYLDDSQGTLHVWQEGELVSAEEFRESRWTRVATIALLTSPVMLIVWAYVARQRRRSRAARARCELTSMVSTDDGPRSSIA